MKTTECDHTVHLTNERGERIGSWTEDRVGNRVRVVCKHCGKFYGVKVLEKGKGKV